MLGSTVLTTLENLSGSTAFRYLPFGEQVKGDQKTPFTFTGLRKEHIGGGNRSELYSAQYRHLRPRLGRWTARDPAGDVDGPNLYQYVRNRPLVAVDPTGLITSWSAVYGILARVQSQSAAARDALQALGQGYEPGQYPRPLPLWKAHSGETYLNDCGTEIVVRVRFDLTDEEAATTLAHEATHVRQIRDRLPGQQLGGNNYLRFERHASDAEFDVLQAIIGVGTPNLLEMEEAKTRFPRSFGPYFLWIRENAGPGTPFTDFLRDSPHVQRAQSSVSIAPGNIDYMGLPVSTYLAPISGP